MRNILFMPFLNLSSGHYQAADALIECLHLIDSSIHCEKVDILQYSYGKVEKTVSNIYLKWIHYSPSTYNWIYQKLVCTTINRQAQKRYHLYEMLFAKFMCRLIAEKQPEMIVCTHALPSYIAQRLKQLGLISIPVVNVYTDYFINNVWGITEIEYHLVPDYHLKQWLLSKGVKEKQIFVTGIPVHPKITKSTIKQKSLTSTLSVLITGGSLGAGHLRSLIQKAGSSTGKVKYKVLCGKNETLYNDLIQLNQPSITPLRYIQCRERMNELYNEMDAIITKPGGVTISESLHKALPIFIYHALPGQEEFNLKHLKQQGLVYHLEHWERRANIEQELIGVLRSTSKLNDMHLKIIEYQQQTNNDLLETLRTIIESQDESRLTKTSFHYKQAKGE